jgi:hypothetical protein
MYYKFNNSSDFDDRIYFCVFETTVSIVLNCNWCLVFLVVVRKDGMGILIILSIQLSVGNYF